jgi:hypothetical protein
MTEGTTQLVGAGARDVALSADGRFAYVSNGTGDILAFDTVRGTQLGVWHVADRLGAISLSDDGSFLLASDPRQPLLYKVSTSTGAVLDVIVGVGTAYSDVEIVDSDTAIASGSNPTIINLTDDSYTLLSGASYYSGQSIMTQNNHFTLLGETGISNGPLFLFDYRTNTVVASGDDYQSPYTGYNSGIQAVSEAAGKVLQLVYSSTMNIYDLAIHYLRSVSFDHNVSGLQFNNSGARVYALKIGSHGEDSALVVYDAITFNTLASYRYDRPSTDYYYNPSYGNALVVSDDESTFLITDPSGAVTLLSLGQQRNGSAGADTLTGTVGGDTLRGLGGDDVILGYLGTDTLTGAAGNDIFRGLAVEFSGDTITDFSAGDSIHVTDATAANFSFTRVGDVVTLGSGESFTLTGTSTLRLVTEAASAGGMQIVVDEADPRSDFTGDGVSDILWRNDNGTLSWWSGSGPGFAYSGPLIPLGNEWQVAGTDDFNADGRADVLWRHSSGALTFWASTGSDFSYSAGITGVGNDWQVAGTGDVNGDGRDDVLWRHSTGALSYWTSTGSGFDTSAPVITLSNEWEVAGTGDFNGDGMDDVLWRHDTGALSYWASTENGFSTSAPVIPLSNEWQVAGTGDFNGDDMDDVLWRHDTGALSYWASTENGFSTSAAVIPLSHEWQVAGTGDFNGDGMDDVLWRHDTGALSYWASTDGGFSTSAPVIPVTTDWHVVNGGQGAGGHDPIGSTAPLHAEVFALL